MATRSSCSASCRARSCPKRAPPRATGRSRKSSRGRRKREKGRKNSRARRSAFRIERSWDARRRIARENRRMKLVAGLGNIGRKYDHTRHNVGFEVIAALATEYASGAPKGRFQGETYDAKVGPERVILLMP